jgi:hypothetical protein
VRLRRIVFKLVIPTVIVVTASLAMGQSVWLPDTTSTMIGLEVWKVDRFEGSAGSYRKLDPSVASASWFLTAQYPLGARTLLIAEIPFAFLAYKEPRSGWDSNTGRYYSYIEEESETGFGNPFVGIKFWDPKEPMFVIAGVRLPMMSRNIDRAAYMAQLTDVDRAEAFERDVLSPRLHLGGKFPHESGLLVKFHLGVSWIVYSGERSELDNDVIWDYGVHTWLHSEYARMGAGITGRYASGTVSAGGYGSGSIHQFGFVAFFGGGIVQPGFHIRLPLDDDLHRIGVRFTYGVSLLIWPG